MVTRTSDSLSRQKSANLAPANRVKMELAASMTMPRINVCVCPDLHLRTAKKVMQKIIYPYSYLKDRQTNTWTDNFSNATTIMLFEHRGSKSKGIRIDSPIDGLQSIPGDSKYKDIAAMLVPSTIEANKHSFVKVPPTWPP